MNGLADLSPGKKVARSTSAGSLGSEMTGERRVRRPALIGAGVVIGLVFGIALGNIVLGIVLGAVLGIAISLRKSPQS